MVLASYPGHEAKWYFLHFWTSAGSYIDNKGFDLYWQYLSCACHIVLASSWILFTIAHANKWL